MMNNGAVLDPEMQAAAMCLPLEKRRTAGGLSRRSTLQIMEIVGLVACVLMCTYELSDFMTQVNRGAYHRQSAQRTRRLNRAVRSNRWALVYYSPIFLFTMSALQRLLNRCVRVPAVVNLLMS